MPGLATCRDTAYRADISTRYIGPTVSRSPASAGAVMRRIDYDTEQYQDYARGRALTEQQLQAWISAFGAVLPERRPLAGLDVGSGTGRFTPALAQAFGPVTGVEPSVRMREIAQAQSQYPGVRYLAARRGHASAVRQRRLRSHVLVLAPRPGQAAGSPGAGQGAQARRAAAAAREFQRPSSQAVVAGALPPWL